MHQQPASRLIRRHFLFGQDLPKVDLRHTPASLFSKTLISAIRKIGEILFEPKSL